MSLRRIAPAVILVLALAAPASAAQLDPRTAPITTGPLIEDSSSYEGDRCSRNVIKGMNDEVAAVAKFCWTFYRLDPNGETDASRDYGVWWIQSRVKPKNGWCANKIVTQMAMSEGSTMHAISGRDYEATSAKSISPKLTVDAEGAASAPASVRQSLTLIPKKLVTKLVPSTNNFKMVWTGATRRAVAAAGGIEGSWAAEAGPPVFLPGMSPRMVSDC